VSGLAAPSIPVPEYVQAVEEAAVVMSNSSHAIAVGTSGSGPAARDNSAVALDTIAAEVVLLRQVEEQRSRLGELRTELVDRIKSVMGAAEVGTVAGVPVVSHKSVLSIVLDQSDLKARYPAVAEDCLTITEARRFKLLKAAS
jgi:predicted phage-related endonuclease